MRQRIILASSSQARSRILSQCKIPHRIIVSNAAEIMDFSENPSYITLFNATAKVKAVSQNLKSGIIIGADTVVLSGRNLIGKPKNKSQARQIFHEFSKKTILVYTGLCVKDVKRKKTVKAVTISKVKTKKLSNQDLNKFIKLIGPFDKAGGFSIEGVGSLVFDDIEGSFYNILGLPMVTLNKLFKKLGINLLSTI